MGQSKGRGLWWLSGLLAAACGDDATPSTGTADSSSDSSGEVVSAESSSSSSADSSTTLAESSGTSGTTSAESGSESDASTGTAEASSESSTGTQSESSSDGSSSESSSTTEAVTCDPPMLGEDVILDCDLDGGYTISQYRADEPGVPTAHMISIYYPLYFGHDAPVHFDLPGSNILVLHSATPTQWAVDLGPQGTLDQIWVFGGVLNEEGELASTVSAPEGVEVIYGGDPAIDTSDCWDLPDDQQDACMLEARRVAYGEAIGQNIDSADHCYDGQHFELEPRAECGGTPGASLPECAPQNGPAGVAQPACDSILAESVHCAKYDGQDVGLVGMDTGDTCVLAQTQGEVTPFEGGMGWIGDELYLCDATVWRISLLDGTATDSGTSCAMVTDYGGEILVRPDPFGDVYGYQDVVVYPDFAALQADTPSAIHEIESLHGLHMATDGDALYTAWFHDHVAQHWDIATGVREPDSPFLCWDGSIGGVDVLDGTTYVLADSEQLIKRFDTTTGAFLGEVEVAGFFFDIGLACRTGG